MKKFVSMLVLGSALALTACSSNDEASYQYESQAPYADERTVGADEQPMRTAPAERVFVERQRK